MYALLSSAKQAVELKVESPVIWNTMTQMEHHEYSGIAQTPMIHWLIFNIGLHVAINTTSDMETFLKLTKLHSETQHMFHLTYVFAILWLGNWNL